MVPVIIIIITIIIIIITIIIIIIIIIIIASLNRIWIPPINSTIYHNYVKLRPCVNRASYA